MDLVVGGLALLGAAPLMGLIALGIRLTSPGPVLLRQERMGLDGRLFHMLKFRTMRADADGAVHRDYVRSLIETDPSPAGRDGLYKLAVDDRVTRVGRVLRSWSLDELPQLVNVARGQMSLVGPRADLVEQAESYAERERRRLTVRPGITGWAQVNGRDSVSWPERFEQDLWYLDNWSLWLDARILVRTVGELFRAEPEPIEDSLNIERAKNRTSSP